MKINKHNLWMIGGCVLPLLIIFLSPAMGINSTISIFIFIAVMFTIHLFMPMHWKNENHHNQQ